MVPHEAAQMFDSKGKGGGARAGDGRDRQQIGPHTGDCRAGGRYRFKRMDDHWMERDGAV